MNVERFTSKIERGAESECWPFRAYRNACGYGVFGVGNRKNELAHRIAWTLEHGPIPAGLCVLHRCDNPPCCNPAHLFLGTPRDNYDDMRRKGRERRAMGDAHGLRRRPERRAVGARNGHSTRPEQTPRGERSGRARLTENDIREIRTRYEAGGVRLLDLAHLHGVSVAHVHRVVRHRRWRHVA